MGNISTINYIGKLFPLHIKADVLGLVLRLERAVSKPVGMYLSGFHYPTTHCNTVAIRTNILL
jgi:hypothetical protein